MIITAGSRLGAYEVRGRIGAGGMGEVYRAYDPRLGREVAIKLLPASFVFDEERRLRFEQEARATSALNHPNILTVFDVGQENGVPFLVCELLEGDELRARLAGGPLPVRTAIEYARQIVNGLSAAHDKGIVHRDLKPENVFVTHDDRIKILDFGLAKLREPGTSAESDGETRRVLTDVGAVLGTAAYMAPEQVRGQLADHRTDIFAIGVILDEMVTGRAAFRRETPAETMTAILKEDPPSLADSHPGMNPAVDRIVRRCLEKRPERRFQSTSDLGFALEALAAPSTGSGVSLGTATAPARTSDRSRRRTVRTMAMAIGTVAVIAGAVYADRRLARSPAPDQVPLRLAFAPPADLAFNDDRADSAVISPDGQKIAFTATKDGRSQLYVRLLATGESKLLPGAEDPLEPFWSPDSRSIAFGSQGKLVRAELSGGSAQALCDAARLTGGTWSAQGIILFGADFGTELSRVAATGGEPQAATHLDPQAGDTSHSNPYFLPDGRHFLFRFARVGRVSGVSIGSLDSPGITQILDGGTNAVYAAPGWLLYARNQQLVAQRLREDLQGVTGDPIPVAAIQGRSVEFGAFGRFSVSNTGVLIMQDVWQRRYQLLWFERDGRRSSSLGDAVMTDFGFEPRLSPDGRRVVTKRQGNIWVSDLDGSNAIRLTASPSQLPVWASDGAHLLFAGSIPGVGRGIVRIASNGVGNPELILKGTMYPYTTSRDGHFLLYGQRGVRSRTDIWMLPLADPAKARPLVATPFEDRSAALSPNGRWIAYISDESGTREVYVQSFGADGTLGTDRRRVSTQGASIPNWRADSQELFYVAADGQIMSVSVPSTGPASGFGQPHALFQTRLLNLFGTFHEFDVTPDGRRFLVGTVIGDTPPPPPTVILNWLAGLQSR